jgi:hypothetical protein
MGHHKIGCTCQLCKENDIAKEQAIAKFFNIGDDKTIEELAKEQSVKPITKKKLKSMLGKFPDLNIVDHEIEYHKTIKLQSKVIDVFNDILSIAIYFDPTIENIIGKKIGKKFMKIYNKTNKLDYAIFRYVENKNEVGK